MQLPRLARPLHRIHRLHLLPLHTQLRGPNHLALLPPTSLVSLITQPFLRGSEREDVDPSSTSAPLPTSLTHPALRHADRSRWRLDHRIRSRQFLVWRQEYTGVPPADMTCSICGEHVVKRTRDNAHVPPPPKLASASTCRYSSTLNSPPSPTSSHRQLTLSHSALQQPPDHANLAFPLSHRIP